MRQREVAFLAIGLIVGLLIGGLLFSTNENLRRLISGSAVAVEIEDPVYYLLELNTVRDWLTETNATAEPVDENEIAQAVERIRALSSTTDFRVALLETQDDIDLLLGQAYTRLGGPVVTAESLETTPYAACLGMESDPYAALPGLFVYMQVPSSGASALPETWVPLEEPKENTLFWQLLDCQPLTESQT